MALNPEHLQAENVQMMAKDFREAWEEADKRGDDGLRTNHGILAATESLMACIDAVDYAVHLLLTATTLPQQGHAIEKLSNDWFNLRTWHPSFDARSGTLSWERD